LSNQLPPSTRNRIIGAALGLFAAKGYGATTIADIAGAAKANPGSVYFFFPTKQEVLLAVLGAYGSGIHPMLLEPAWRGVEDPIERVFALLDKYRSLLTDSDCTYGCPIGSLALELHEPDPPVREALATNFAAWTAAIEACLDDAGKRLPSDVDRHALAVFVLTTMEGAVMLARTYRGIEAYDAAIEQLHTYFALLQRKPAVRRTGEKKRGPEKIDSNRRSRGNPVGGAGRRAVTLKRRS
jgi:TetR/AcrR family transcriptional regulator, transcriptional repressor for nem operon